MDDVILHTSFSTVIQSYQDDSWVIRKGKAACNGTPFMVGEISAFS